MVEKGRVHLINPLEVVCGMAGATDNVGGGGLGGVTVPLWLWERILGPWGLISNKYN